MNVFEQAEIDKKLTEIDGTENKGMRRKVPVWLRYRLWSKYPRMSSPSAAQAHTTRSAAPASQTRGKHQPARHCAQQQQLAPKCKRRISHTPGRSESGYPVARAFY